MIYSIKITDNYEEIDAEYKKFKEEIYRNWYEASELSLQYQEKKLFNIIKSILKENEKNSEGRLINMTISDDNLVRALIGATVLSKYSFLYRNDCVHFFTVIEANIFDSIQKRRFFIKRVVKQFENKKRYLWDDFLNKFTKNYLPIGTTKYPEPITSIENSLIFISYLTRYAPDYAISLSTEIFSRLFDIIQKVDYVLDINYDILSYTGQTLDEYFDGDYSSNKYFANYAIELLRFFIEKVFQTSYSTVNIELDQILEWSETCKKLAVLSILFEKCDKFMTNKIDSVYDKVSKIRDEGQEVDCLLTRILIYCSNLKDDVDIGSFENMFSIGKDESKDAICGKLQNIKLLITMNHFFFENISQAEVTAIASNCLNNDSNKIVSNALDLLNSYFLYINKKQQEGDKQIKIDARIIDDLKLIELPINYDHVIEFMLEKDKSTFITKLCLLYKNDQKKTLQFLSDSINDGFSENLIQAINSHQEKDELKKLIEKDLFDSMDITNFNTIVPHILANFLPNEFFSDESINKIFHQLLCNPSEKVKLSILKCFNNTLNDEVINKYDLESKFNSSSTITIFKMLSDNFLQHDAQVETIKLLCNLQKLDSNLKFYDIFTNCLNFFSTFSKKDDTSFKGIKNSAILLNKLLYIADLSQYIFKEFPTKYQKELISFLEFALDFINLTAKNKNTYVNHSNLSQITPPKTFFQQKFFKASFCSLISTIEIFLKNDKKTVEPFFSDIIVSCANNLQSKIGQLETQSILSLLEQTIYHMKLEEVIQIQKDRNITSLFTIVFKSGTRFITPNISQSVFKILGFLGVQPLFTPPKPLYDDYDVKYDFESDFRSSVKLKKQYKRARIVDNVYYAICSNCIFKILENDKMKHSRFFALETLINILQITKADFINDHIMRCFKIFNNMIDESLDEDKKKFVPLLKLMINAVKNAVEKEVDDIDLEEKSHINKSKFESKVLQKDNFQKFIYELVLIFEKLWNYNSCETVKLFSSTFKTHLLPYLKTMIPYIRSLQDDELIIDLLSSIFLDCYKDETEISSSLNLNNFDIIDILLKKTKNGRYNIIPKLRLLIPHISNPINYLQPIISMCLDYINQIKSSYQSTLSNCQYFYNQYLYCYNHCQFTQNYYNEYYRSCCNYYYYSYRYYCKIIESFYLDDAVEILRILKKTSNITNFNKFARSINETLEAFPDKLSQFNQQIVESSSDVLSFDPVVNTRSQAKKDKYTSLFLATFSISKFIDVVKKITENEITPLYIQQWLEDVKKFCIKNSPSKIIRAVAPFAKINKFFSRSIFNSAFHSCVKFIATKLKNSQPKISIISKTFLDVLPKCTSESQAIITDLIEFMGRCGNPIFKSNEFNRPITSIFSNKPPLSLHYALLNFEKRINNSENDLQLAFLNAGLLDKYQQFTRIFNISNNNKLDLPIFAGSNEVKYHLERANTLFINYFYDRKISEPAFHDAFNNEILQCQNETISHLFRTAALIQEYWSTNEEGNDNLTEILTEIEQGFQSLGRESGPQFSHGFTSVIQSIIYAQQLNELREMLISKGETNNTEMRFKESLPLTSFLPPILLLRMYAKGLYKDSNQEKIHLLKLCRETRRWKLMKFYKDSFIFKNDIVPNEIQYEMMYYNIANNSMTKEDFESLIDHFEREIQNNNSNSEYYNIVKMIKYQQALFYAHSQEEDKWTKVRTICNDITNADSYNLFGLATMRIFETTMDIQTKVSLLKQVIQSYIRAINLNKKYRISNLLTINQLLFKYYNHNDEDTSNNNNNDNSSKDVKADIKTVIKLMKKIPLHYYIDIFSQIISYERTLKEGSFKKYFISFLTEMFNSYPQGVVYDFAFSYFNDKKRFDEPNRIIITPFSSIKLTEEASKCFKESINLTRYLHKVNNDFFTVAYNVINFKISIFLSKETFSSQDSESVQIFIHETLEPFINDYIRPFAQYCDRIPRYEFAKLPKEEKICIEYKDDGFDKLQRAINEIKPALLAKHEFEKRLSDLYQQLIQKGQERDDILSKYGFESTEYQEINDEYAKLIEQDRNLKRIIEDECGKLRRLNNKLSFVIKPALNAKSQKLNEFSELFIRSPELKKMRDLLIPVFGTFSPNSEIVRIHKFISRFTSFQSKQAPKRITMQGSDGHKYSFILKNSEDLRSDQRIMIYHRLLNQFLKSKIRTYTVIPLTSKFGIIQIVKNANGLDEMITYYRRMKNINSVERSFLEERIGAARDDTAGRIGIKDLNTLYGKFSHIQKAEIMGEMFESTKERVKDLRESFWFLTSSSDLWFKFRENYTTSCALTSIVGYIIGIGDRHLKNIMIDNTDGYLVHIDFCDTFEVNQIRTNSPELVPFRLTRNIVEAFGPCKCEGTFRMQCEEFLGIIRENRDQIMSLLNVFITSPIMNFDDKWKLVTSEREISNLQKVMKYKIERVSKKVNGTDHSILLPNDQHIMKQLKGIEESDGEKLENEQEQPLSVHEQVRKLIDTATNFYNISMIYIGWGPQI